MPLLSSKLFLPLVLFLTSLNLNAQLCQGSLGDPVVNITFGSGSNPGPPLGAAATNYNFFPADCPNDGSYTIRNSTSGCFNNTWHVLNSDHTGDANGYFMLVNASFQPSDFYLGTVTGLCGGTTYEFAAWIANVLVNRSGILPNITLTIEKKDGTILQTFNSGDIPQTTSPKWSQIGFFFNTPPNVFEVVLRMKNNAPGGIGNDLALDDITFRPCGPLVTASIESMTNEANLCDGSKQVLNFKAVISSGYSTPVYQWQINTNGLWQDIVGATKDTYQRLPTSTGSYQYRLTVANAGNINISSCRVASNPVTINVRSNPTIVLTNDGPQCNGAALKVLGKVNFNAPNSVQHNWSGPGVNGTISYKETTDNNSITSYELTVASAAASNAQKFYLTATNSYKCSSIDSTTPVLYAKPVADFILPSSGCENKTNNFTDASTIGAGAVTKWSWSFGNGKSATSQNAIQSFTKAGSYAVSLIVESDKNCKSDTARKNFIINEPPVANFVLPKVCLADPFALFLDSSTVSDNSQNPFSYLWNFGDASSSQNTSTTKDPQHAYTATGNYNVKLTVTTSSGCIKDTAKTFTVNGSQPKAVFSIDNSGKLCSDDEVIITNNSTVDFGSVNKLEIYWDASDPTKKTVDDNPSPGKKFGFTYPDPPGSGAASYNVRYIAYSGMNCMNESSQLITVNQNPKVLFDVPGAVCEEDSAYTIKASELSGISGAGRFLGPGININGLFSPSLAGDGEHAIGYIYTSGAGCSDTLVQKLIVHPQPTISAGADLLVLKGSSATINSTAVGSGLIFSWTPSTYLSNPSILNPKVKAFDEIRYTLTAQSAEGCINKDDVLVQVVDKLYIPNAFTPDGDGVNDVWSIPYLNSVVDVDVKIFNRLGELVFYTAKENKPWDGKLKGRPQPSGAYVYLVASKENGLKVSGTLVLIR